MTSNSVSTLGLALLSTSTLQNEQVNLEKLNAQLGSGQQFSNLTDYDPTSAHNLMDFQNSITQKQAYLSSMTNVQTRLTLYDQTMNDMESIAAQSGALASSNQSLDPSTVGQLQGQVQAYLKQLTDDLNQQVGGRYIYSGTRYSTVPVTDLSTLSGTPSWPFTPTTSPTLPSYDTQYSSVTVNNIPASGNFQVKNTAGTSTATLSWAAVSAGNVTSVTVDGTPTAVTVTVPNVPATTPAEAAANLQSAINQISSQIPDFTGISASVSGSTVSFSTANVSPTITPDAGGTAGDTTWSSGAAGTTAQVTASSAGASTADSVTIDTNFSVQYGVTSTNPAFQQLIAGLQFMNAATKPGVNAATYSTDMAHATALLQTALTSLQAVHTTVASNQNILSDETNTQNNDITNLQGQLSNIQQVNITQVGTEINTLQAQLQASYSATATLEQLSILKYL